MEAMELSVKCEAIFSGVFAQTFLFFWSGEEEREKESG
jgi:hypothetical protein